MNTCEAYVGKRTGAFGFEPVTCTQSIGLTTLIDASGITHRACGRWGHRANVVRRFGETILPEEPDALDAFKWTRDRDGWPA